MLILCYADAEKAKARGRQVNPIARNRGPCGEPGCEEIGLYTLRPENDASRQDDKTPGGEEKTPFALGAPSAPQGHGAPLRETPSPTSPPEPEPRTPRRNGAAPIPCDQTGTCPHCLLSRVSPVSAFYIPAHRANPEP